MTWEIAERPGYFGPKRDELVHKWDQEFGNWKVVWDWCGYFLEMSEALQIYEDGYSEFVKNNLTLAESITAKYENIIDNAESNVQSGFDYTIQEAKTNHYHDIALRRAFMRNGLKFRGEGLLEIRGPKSVGAFWDPANVPFHKPYDIYKGEIKDYHEGDRNHSFWWRPTGIAKGVENSIEAYYQQCKVILVNR